MPYGFPSAITLYREEFALAIDRIDEADGRPQVIELPAGTVVLPQYRLADQDGYDGEWLCVDHLGKRLAIFGEKLSLSVTL